MIDDPGEIQRLCEGAPGAVEAVGWDEEMAEMCGEESRIYKVNEPLVATKHTTPMPGDIPFDALLVRRTPRKVMVATLSEVDEIDAAHRRRRRAFQLDNFVEKRRRTRRRPARRSWRGFLRRLKATMRGISMRARSSKQLRPSGASSWIWRTWMTAWQLLGPTTRSSSGFESRWRVALMVASNWSTRRRRGGAPSRRDRKRATAVRPGSSSTASRTWTVWNDLL